MYKYKDRAPAETITILEDFFKNGNYDIKINNITESECGTWFCHIELWKNEFFIQSSNGKGINKEYCLASGLAELYERFCIGCPNNLNICYENSLYNEEEKLTLNDIFSCDYIMDFFNAYSNNEQIKQKIVKIITNNKPVGLKYTSITDKHHHIILEPRLMMKINGSQGMSAGNTLNEAIVQANCELYEKYLSFYFFDSYQNNTYYALNIMHNQQIEKIKNLGYKFYVIDLSYTYQLPVLMAILITPKGQIRINFGSFPVFEIALERIITELYQGIFSFQNLDDLIIPYKSRQKEDIISSFLTTTVNNFFPEDFFEKLTYVDTPSNLFFPNISCTSEELLQYCITINQNKGYNAYYHNFSNLENFYAIQMIIPELDLTKYKKYYIKKHNKVSYLNAFHIIQLYKNIYKNIKQNEYNYMPYLLLKKYYKNHPEDVNMAHMIITKDPFNFDPDFITSGSIYDFLEAQIADSTNQAFYITLYNYIQNKKYSDDEIKRIMLFFFNKEVSDEDLKKYNNDAYLIKQTFHEPLKKFI